MTSNTPIIRAPDETDHPAILSVLRASFGREEEARLVEKLWGAKAVILEFFAAQDDEIIGYCAFSEVTADPKIDGLLLGLAPLAVTPDRQKRGVGAQLVEHGLKTCRARDAAIVVVLGEPAYYQRFGFAPASKSGVSWAAMDAGDAFQLIDYTNAADGTAHKIDYHATFSEV